jgi:hypothetical protein
MSQPLVPISESGRRFGWLRFCAGKARPPIQHIAASVAMGGKSQGWKPAANSTSVTSGNRARSPCLSSPGLSRTMGQCSLALREPNKPPGGPMVAEQL